MSFPAASSPASFAHQEKTIRGLLSSISSASSEFAAAMMASGQTHLFSPLFTGFMSAMRISSSDDDNHISNPYDGSAACAQARYLASSLIFLILGRIPLEVSS